MFLFHFPEDTWIMTTRTVGQNQLKNNNSSTTLPKRNKDRKKDKEKDRDRDRTKEKDRDKENNQNRKTIHQNVHYDDFDYSLIKENNNNNQINSKIHHDNINNNNNNNHHSYNINYNERNSDKIGSKQSKGFILNKPHGVWPTHSNKGINGYHGNETEPKYYLGMF